MSALTSRRHSPPRSRPWPAPGTRATAVPADQSNPWRHALEGAAAALCAVIAMAAVSGLGLTLLGAGSVGSLWSLTMALTAMAVGASVSAGSEVSVGTGAVDSGLAGMFGGDGMSPSVSGAADAVPLGVTLAGALVLWFAFSRGMRQRRLDAGELAVRAFGAGVVALAAFMVIASLARGTVTMPASAVSGLTGGQGAEGVGGELFGGSGTASQMAVTFQAHVGSAALGAVLWVAVALGVGCLISRRVRLSLGGALDRQRAAWGPSLSTVVRTILVVAAVPLVPLAIVGTIVGGRAGMAAGAALLLAPNALAVFLTLGVGSPWTVGTHSAQGEGGNPLAGMMGALGGMGGGQQPTTQPDRTEQLRALSVGGWPLWLGALAVTGLLLLACAYAAALAKAPVETPPVQRRGRRRPASARAAVATDPAHTLPLHPYRGPLARHVGMAERFGVVTAVVLGGTAWLAGLSGHFGISMFGSEMGGMRAELTGGILWTALFGLVVGGVAGLTGSLLSARRGGRGSR
jgi:hypothetical protein